MSRSELQITWHHVLHVGDILHGSGRGQVCNDHANAWLGLIWYKWAHYPAIYQEQLLHNTLNSLPNGGIMTGMSDATIWLTIFFCIFLFLSYIIFSTQWGGDEPLVLETTIQPEKKQLRNSWQKQANI